MKIIGALHVITARQSVLAVSLLQYIAIFYLLKPDDFFVFGVLMICSIYCRNVFEAVLQPSAINYAPHATQSLAYHAHYFVIFFVSYFLARGDLLLLVCSISVGFNQLLFNPYFSPYFSNAYAAKKYFRLSLCQACADLLCLIFGFTLFIMTSSVYCLVIRFLLYPIFLLIFCRMYLDGTYKAHTRTKQPQRSLLYLNMQHFFGFLGRSGDRILIVSLIDPVVFAFYDRAMTGLRFIYSALSQPLTPYVLIQFKKIRDDDEKDVVQYLARFSFCTYLFGWLIFWALSLILPLFDRFIPTEWLDAIVYLKALIWLIPLNMTIFNASSFFIALHREDLNLLSGILSAFSIIFAFAVGLLLGGIQTALIFLVIALAVNVAQVYTLILYNHGLRAYFRFYLIPAFHVTMFLLVS